MENIKNIKYIELTCEVSKLDKSNNFNLEHPLKIWLISLTWEVLKLGIYKEVNLEQ